MGCYKTRNIEVFEVFVKIGISRFGPLYQFPVVEH